MKKLVTTLTGVIAVFLVMSCGSTPAAEPEIVPEVKEVVEEVKQEVEEVKQEVEEVVQAVDYSAHNGELLLTVEASREKAIAADAKKYYPDGFDAAENQYTTVKNDISSNLTTDYEEQLKDLANRYESLAAAAQANALKEKADSLSLGGEDGESYSAGEKALSEYASMLTSASGKELLDKASEALNAYNQVVNKGLKANAARERNAALEAKKNADSVKAGVAKKDEYKKASDAFKKADSSYITADIEGAYNGYKAAKTTFNSLYETISAKRAAAQALIDAAKQKVAESASYAEEADTIAPLESEVAGIEKEDAVLLEEDNLANPEDSVINVEEGLTAKAAEKVAETAIAAEEALNKAVEEVTDSEKKADTETPAEEEAK